jgi:hypothetical protein
MPFTPARANRKPRAPETSVHRRARRERQRARLIIGVAKARDILCRHHAWDPALGVHVDDALTKVDFADIPEISTILEHVQHITQWTKVQEVQMQTVDERVLEGANYTFQLAQHLVQLCAQVNALQKAIEEADRKPRDALRHQTGVAKCEWTPQEVTIVTLQEKCGVYVGVASGNWEPVIPRVTHVISSSSAPAEVEDQFASGTSPSIEQEVLPYGTLVTFAGLQSRGELNGASGNINSFDSDRQRYAVTIQTSLERAWFKRANLVIAGNNCDDIQSSSSSSGSDQSGEPSDDGSDWEFMTSDAAMARLTAEEQEETLALRDLCRRRKRKYAKR